VTDALDATIRFVTLLLFSWTFERRRLHIATIKTANLQRRGLSQLDVAKDVRQGLLSLLLAPRGNCHLVTPSFRWLAMHLSKTSV
jgi:hypothetical protein